MRMSGPSLVNKDDMAFALGTLVMPYSQAGVLTVRTGTHRLYIEEACALLSVRASVGVAPTGADFIIDVNNNGSTIYTNQATRPTISAAGFTGLSTVTISLVAGDYLTIDIDQIGSTVAGSDLSVGVRLRPGG